MAVAMLESLRQYVGGTRSPISGPGVFKPYRYGSCLHYRASLVTALLTSNRVVLLRKKTQRLARELLLSATHGAEDFGPWRHPTAPRYNGGGAARRVEPSLGGPNRISYKASPAARGRYLRTLWRAQHANEPG